MRIILLSLAAATSLATSVSAAPLSSQSKSVPRPSIAETVKVICEANGYCYRPPGRRKVARWVYGDDAFYGPMSDRGTTEDLVRTPAGGGINLQA
jgi:hypothetical protein